MSQYREELEAAQARIAQLEDAVRERDQELFALKNPAPLEVVQEPEVPHVVHPVPPPRPTPVWDALVIASPLLLFLPALVVYVVMFGPVLPDRFVDFDDVKDALALQWALLSGSTGLLLLFVSNLIKKSLARPTVGQRLLFVVSLALVAPLALATLPLVGMGLGILVTVVFGAIAARWLWRWIGTGKGE